MDKQKTINSFTELTSTELNDIKGGGWWEEFLKHLSPNSVQKNTNPAKPKIS